MFVENTGCYRLESFAKAYLIIKNHSTMPVDTFFSTLDLGFSHLIFKRRQKFYLLGLVTIEIPHLALVTSWSLVLHQIKHEVRYLLNMNTCLLTCLRDVLDSALVHPQIIIPRARVHTELVTRNFSQCFSQRLTVESVKP